MVARYVGIVVIYTTQQSGRYQITHRPARRAQASGLVPAVRIDEIVTALKRYSSHTRQHEGELLVLRFTLPILDLFCRSSVLTVKGFTCQIFQAFS